jgi:NAD(P)-dependent dehydrogenase (short-subunit alcohol dehydrogenase family)
VYGVAADLAPTDGITTLAAHLAEREGVVHALFNNAGASWGAPFEQFPASGWDKIFDVNV